MSRRQSVVAIAGQCNDQRVAALETAADDPRRPDPVDDRHVDIEQNQVIVPRRRARHRIAAIADGIDIAAKAAQQGGGQKA